MWHWKFQLLDRTSIMWPNNLGLFVHKLKGSSFFDTCNCFHCLHEKFYLNAWMRSTPVAKTSSHFGIGSMNVLTMTKVFAICIPLFCSPLLGDALPVPQIHSSIHYTLPPVEHRYPHPCSLKGVAWKFEWRHIYYIMFPTPSSFGGCIAQRKHSCFHSCSPGLESRLDQYFFSLRISLFTA